MERGSHWLWKMLTVSKDGEKAPQVAAEVGDNHSSQLL